MYLIAEQKRLEISGNCKDKSASETDVSIKRITKPPLLHLSGISWIYGYIPD
jgi:hypothetical protein